MNNINMLDEKLAKRSIRLEENNLFSKLEYDKQEFIKESFVRNVNYLSMKIESILKDTKVEKSRIKVRYQYEMAPQASSKLLEDSSYIAEVVVNIGLIIHLYEMFYNLNYKIIIPDGKNIENIKQMLFHTAVNIIFLHEVAHIYYQHELLKNELKFKYGEENPKYKLDMQTLEYDADSFAITKMYEHINSLNNSSESEASKLYYQILIISIHGIVYLFRQIDEFNNITCHPPFLIRENMMINILNNLFDNSEAQKYIDFAEDEFNRQFNVDKKTTEAYYDKLLKYKISISTIQKNYNVLKYEIKRFSLLPIEGIDYIDYRK